MAHSRSIRLILVIAGTLFVAVGSVGIFLPLLPTVPFLLLAAACYARSSDTFHNWLMTNRWFGKEIKNYREGRGLPLKVKTFTISLLWITITSSALLFVSSFPWRIFLLVVAIGVTAHLLCLPTSGRSEGKE